jgi:hypothetical protein
MIAVSEFAIDSTVDPFIQRVRLFAAQEAVEAAP